MIEEESSASYTEKSNKSYEPSQGHMPVDNSYYRTLIRKTNFIKSVSEYTRLKRKKTTDPSPANLPPVNPSPVSKPVIQTSWSQMISNKFFWSFFTLQFLQNENLVLLPKLSLLFSPFPCEWVIHSEVVSNLHFFPWNSKNETFSNSIIVYRGSFVGISQWNKLKSIKGAQS